MTGDLHTSPAVVSVITPSFNQRKFLAATMESVLSQQGDFLLDYVVMDGGSTDGSRELISEYAEAIRNERYVSSCRGVTFRWVSERDNGQADALVKGLRMATGQIIGWLNSDDTYLPGTLQRIVRYFAAHSGTGCVYGRGMYTSDDDVAVSEYPTRPFDPSLLPMTNFICQPAAFFTRAAYEAAGGIDPQLRYALDYDLWIRMAVASKFHYLPEPLATYRLHDESKTMDAGGAVENHAETLETVLRHYRWAPLNRVYGYCLARLRHHSSYSLPAPLLTLAALSWSVLKYLSLNKTPKAGDLKLLSLKNFRLLLSGWTGSPSMQQKDKHQVP